MTSRRPVSPSPSTQLDIFADSADVALRNAVVTALLGAEAQAITQALQALAAAFPGDASLASFEALAAQLAAGGRGPITRHEALADERGRLHALRPAAARALGVDADRWMRQRWAELAGRSARLPFVSTHQDDHAAPLWLRAQDWTACMNAVEAIPSWRRIPVPLGWMLHARLRLGQEDDCWPMLAELAWLAPKRLAELLTEAGSPPLARLSATFNLQWPGDGAPGELAWFPAWLLCEVPALVPRLAQAQPSLDTAPERGMRLMVELLGLERQGRQADLVTRRRQLRDLSAPLWTVYMARR